MLREKCALENMVGIFAKQFCMTGVFVVDLIKSGHFGLWQLGIFFPL